ncbi:MULTISPECIES: MBL fold metallo-hydrolase [Clostridium]|uniref:MBL fold metallo-hydrolase n=1 Tax=Clostridium TaxID=1485 RepID=UPI001898C49A|nr:MULTISPECIES: MBL fold metallo-hydrolase [Clostridium]MBS7129365.1 MBL fold metallo-hydrolase [Clostridium sp.]MDB2074452.1 MBL fold metallo-hydrolase [Clostridium paraputrificum]MDB2077593.1 MBL fold metallo-hydrolase [Clostridium paraputrificum]MDB2084662.1 MBL fold metallo-hydrolase [Clostridium paraputrificum]MDB2092231.1 MBL fold metallo-hydrolase [Clostridium paraputrificum]
MIIKAIPAGIYDANCYIVMDEKTRDAVVLDPGGDGEMLERAIKDMGANVKSILLTHGHMDHVGGVEYLSDKLNVPFYISKIDEEYMEKDNYVFGSIRNANGYLEDGNELSFGSLNIKVIATPGHTKGGLCFLIEDKLFTGDTLFQGSIGRTDFIGGSFSEIINSIKTKLLPLGDEIEVYPGHGPKSSIGYEKGYNMYLNDYDSLI